MGNSLPGPTGDESMNTVEQQLENAVLHVVDCGLADYRQVLARQQELSEARRANRVGDTVLIVEHPPVITLGARQSANKLLIGPEELPRRGVDLVEIRRGGGTTAHNPGQLVFYPILHLQQRRLGVSEYVRTLEAIGVDLLEALGLVGQRRKGYPGLWVNDRKIASIGVRVSRSVTRHGMALNIANDLSLFDLMVPCGLDGVQMTSVARELGQAPDMDVVKTQLIALLRRYFEGSPR
ncbi:MAG: lipoyl(octanoyl) transferase LipB [Phycisphaerales bacterium]|nr:MAG: lipoyl(octanoyl) transferase LipB [Phycisphaerales bacterium]